MFRYIHDLIERGYFWWVGHFIPSVGNPPTVEITMHAADTAGYWAQAVASVLTVVVALFLAGTQGRSSRKAEKSRRMLTRQAIQSICFQGYNKIGHILDGEVGRAFVSGDLNYIPGIRRMFNESYEMLRGISVNDLVDAQALESAIVAKKILKDIDQILSFLDVKNSSSINKDICQLAAPADQLHAIEKELDRLSLMRQGFKWHYSLRRKMPSWFKF